MSTVIRHAPEGRAPWGEDVIQLDDLKGLGVMYRIKDFQNGVASHYKIKRSINDLGWEGVIMSKAQFEDWKTNAVGPYSAYTSIETSDDYVSTNYHKVTKVLNNLQTNVVAGNYVYEIKRSQANINWDGKEIVTDAFPIDAVMLSFAFFEELRLLQP